MNYRNLHLYNFVRSKTRRYPQSAPEMLESWLFKQWWFYSIELLPGIITQGIFPETMPLPARMLLRKCDLKRADCLDIGSMEGLLPVLMCRQGARSVLATDFGFHSYARMAALMKYYDVAFRFKQVGLLYDLAKKIPSWGLGGFDLINLSGVLYHVFSPLHVLAGLRPLLKKNGLLILSTNVINRPDHSMEFNNCGKLQSDLNTFWYISIRLLDYMLRYFQLVPIDCLYHKYTPKDGVRYSMDFDAGYLAVVCRAVEDRGASFNDKWLNESIAKSWEYRLCDQEMMDAQSSSAISYGAGYEPVDLCERVNQTTPLEVAEHSHDTHLLKLGDTI